MKTKKLVFKEHKKTIKQNLAQSFIEVIELRDEEFYYENNTSKVALIWSVFKEFRVSEDIILLDLCSTQRAAYLIHKSQVGEQQFEEVIMFLKEKIKNPAHPKTSGA